jgi:hypothetical protein
LESGMSADEWVKSYFSELYSYKQKAYEYSLYPLVESLHKSN